MFPKNEHLEKSCDKWFGSNERSYDKAIKKLHFVKKSNKPVDNYGRRPFKVCSLVIKFLQQPMTPSLLLRFVEFKNHRYNLWNVEPCLNHRMGADIQLPVTDVVYNGLTQLRYQHNSRKITWHIVTEFVLWQKVKLLKLLLFCALSFMVFKYHWGWTLLLTWCRYSLIED